MGYGVENTGYAAEGEEGPAKVFVRDRSRVVGIVPVKRLPCATVEEVLEADVVIFGYVYWSPGLRVAGCGAAEGLLIGLREGRPALFRIGIEGPLLLALLPEESAAVAKVAARDFPRSARLDPATGVLTLKVPLPKRSRTSIDVFAVTLRLPVTGDLGGTWHWTE
jgi:hypothetical protein